jgi:selenocysteine lyase/cysteine desulfurase
MYPANHVSEYKFFGPHAGILYGKKGLRTIHAYKLELTRALLTALESVPGSHLYGLTKADRLENRVATFSFRLKGLHLHAVAKKLAAQGIYVWDGNDYALNVTKRLGEGKNGGTVRVGGVHYNTLEEVEQLRTALLNIATG